jgi:hypothetical protein
MSVGRPFVFFAHMPLFKTSNAFSFFRGHNSSPLEKRFGLLSREETQGKEVTTMTYDKPQATLVGEACAAVQSTMPKRSIDSDSNAQITATAYEADE